MSNWRKVETNRSNAIAETILAQLGGRMFRAMVGASQFVVGASSLQFKIGEGAKDGINKVLVELTPADTYTVSFWLVTRHGALRVAEVTDVYCDTLQDVFEQHTGFYVTLRAR